MVWFSKVRGRSTEEEPLRPGSVTGVLEISVPLEVVAGARPSQGWVELEAPMEMKGVWWKKNDPGLKNEVELMSLTTVRSEIVRSPFAPFDRGKEDGGFLEPLPDPLAPQPLLFMPWWVGGQMIRALVDSGASDSFVSEEMVVEGTKS